MAVQKMQVVVIRAGRPAGGLRSQKTLTDNLVQKLLVESGRCRMVMATDAPTSAGSASDRGQPTPARGVESIKSTTFREAKKAPASLSAGASSLLIGESKGSLP